MGTPLPRLGVDEFTARLLRAMPAAVTKPPTSPLRPGWPELLWQHYEEMRRWNPKLSLIGPGTASEVVERHYVESLRALPLLDLPHRRMLVDIGSGGGFPGLALAIARPDLDVVLVEPNQRKCAFLAAAIRRIRKAEALAEPASAAWSCRVLNARVERPVEASAGWPQGADVVTSRALAWTHDIHQSLHLRWPGVRCLLWVGRELPELPSGATVVRQVSLGSHRRIVEILDSPAPLP